MSVILFSKSEVYQEMADAYEGLKQLGRLYTEVNDEKFYKALRRLYFANVAAYICQYHDDTPLSATELSSIDSFQVIEGRRNPFVSCATQLKRFLSAWGSYQYNCVTNDGEIYCAKESQEYIESLLSLWTNRVLETVSDEA